MATSLEKLTFSLSLMDKVSGPAGKIKSSLSSIAENANNSFAKMAGGVAGIGAAGLTLQSITSPANELNRSVGEVRSLGVAEEALDKLANKSVLFSMKYGESASDFVKSSYDIQSAIAGLTGNELASFTNASNILAKGTKSDAGTITDYMGTMYGIFQNSANAMGKSKWVEQLTGQTASAVQMFKTTGSEMAGAFGSLGAAATSADIGIAEQMAVMGQLQATMSGSEAGTKYKAFLSGIGGAQEKLNLSFIDSQGKMLGMSDILGKLKGKFGDTLDVAESDALKKAFGSDEAVGLIKLLMNDTDGLANNIEKLGNISGMGKAETMAKAMVNPFDQWSKGVTAVKIGLGQALLPVLYPAIEGMAKGAGVLYNWTQKYPTLTKYIGFTVIGLVGLTAAGATFALVSGGAQMATMGWSSVIALFSAQGKIATASTWLWNTAIKAGTFSMGFLRKALVLGQGALRLLSIAFMTNPIGLIIGGISLAIGGLIYYWNDLKAAFMNSTWGQAIMVWLKPLIGQFKFFSGVVSSFFNIFKTVDISAIIDGVMGKIQKLAGAWNWMADKLGFGDGDKDIKQNVNVRSSMLDATKQVYTPRAGRTPAKSIANSVSNNSSKSNTVNIGTIHTNQAVNPREALIMGGV